MQFGRQPFVFVAMTYGLVSIMIKTRNLVREHSELLCLRLFALDGLGGSNITGSVYCGAQLYGSLSQFYFTANNGSFGYVCMAGHAGHDELK